MRNARVWIVLVLAVYVALEAVSFAALFLLKTVRHIEYAPVSVRSITARHRSMLEDLLAGKTTYLAHSATLGWSIKPNGSAPLFRANSKGFRANREYTLTPPERVLRISTFGDSFTHGDDVKNDDTYQEIMMSTHANLEVLNFGVGGFGLDQGFLRYQEEGLAYNARIVLIGFMSENIYRNVSVFRPFYTPGTGLPLAKPRYVIENGKLVLLKNPMQELAQYQDLLANPGNILPQLGAHDHFFQTRYRERPLDILPSVRLFRVVRYQRVGFARGIEKNGRYDTDSEAFKVTAAIFDQFVGMARRHNSVPVVVVFPNRTDVLRYRRDGTKRYDPLLADFRAKGYWYVDLLDAFDTYGRGNTVDDLVPVHYSPLGNRLVAQHVWRYLTESGLTAPTTP